VLAQVCQDVLKHIGSIKTISQETGTISGYVGRLMGWSGRGNILLRIAKKGDLTELHIQTSHTEASGEGATDDLATFTKALGQDQRLAGKSTGGWEESSPAQETPTRRVGFLLGLGILLMPYIFSWFTLGKGYSSRVRFVALVPCLINS
jgi:hypothetical protein